MRDPERARGPVSGAPLRRLLVWAVLAVPLGGGPFQDARADCREVAKPLAEALAAGDLEGARSHYDAVQREFSCPDAFLAQAGRKVSNLHAQVAQERMAGGASLDSQRALLEKGLGYAGTWITLALLGDVAHEARDYDRAAALYQRALVAINDEVETPQLPPEPQIHRIRRLAEQSLMLARRYVETPVNRSGEPDGLRASTHRGVKVGARVEPITFQTGTAEFDTLGRQYAEDMVEDLIRQPPARIILSAHTDERGTEAYNLALSRDRGEAVRRFLQSRGVTQPIEVIAKGESEPRNLVDPQHYKQQEVWQLNRRVEWIRREEE